jgi:hypothetical protein
VSLVLIVGAILIVIGVIALAEPDWAWAFTERYNSARGVASDRSETWERANRIGAVIGIVAGVALVLVSLGR